MMSLPGLLLVLPLVLAAQDVASVSGQVINAVTGDPIRKAAVSLIRADSSIAGRQALASAYQAATDASGKFAITGVTAGKYRLLVSRSGFVSSEYGARSPRNPGTVLTVSSGRDMRDLSVRLTPQGVVSGRIVDEDGDPVTGSFVQLLRYGYSGQGLRQFLSANAANTDDRGEYRIFGIAPGKYFLSAADPRNQPKPIPVDGPSQGQPEEDYVPTWYPGTVDPSAAAQLLVGPGEQLTDINLTLKRAHTVRIRGHLVTGLAADNVSTAIMISPRSGSLASLNRSAIVDPKGEFTIRGVLPGSYTLTAFAGQGSRSYSTRRPLEVGSGDVDGVTVTLSAGFEVTGRVRVEGDKPPTLPDVRVRLQPRDPAGIVFGPMANAKVEGDGTFRMENVSPDRYNLFFQGLPDGYYVKAIRTGGADVLASGLDLSASPSGPVEVLLSPNAGRVTGVVQNPDTQQPSPAVTVVLIPQDKERAGQLSYYKTAFTDGSGSFTFRNVVPGDYKLYAWEEVESGAYLDPDFIKPLEAKGESVTVRESTAPSVAVTLIPADSGVVPRN
jgi:hypothetical protein